MMVTKVQSADDRLFYAYVSRVSMRVGKFESTELLQETRFRSYLRRLVCESHCGFFFLTKSK